LEITPNVAGFSAAYGTKIVNSGSQTATAASYVSGTWTTGIDMSSATVTTPIDCGTNTGLCTGLNADLLEGYHGNVAPTASSVVIADASGNISTGWIDNSAFLTGGNSFGTTAVLGPSDTYALEFQIAGSSEGALLSTGEWTFGATALIGTEQWLFSKNQDATSLALFSNTNNRVGK